MNSTITNDSCDFRLSSDEAILILYNIYHKIMFVGFVPLIVTVGLLGNLALLYVVYRIKSMRNTTNFYLCNLAVSDTVLLVASGLQNLITYYTTPISTALSYFSSPTGLMCLLNEVTVCLFYSASVFFVWLVTFDRYLAIHHPIKHLKIKRKRCTLKMTAFVWVISLCMSATSYRNNKVYHYCVSWPDESRYQSLQRKFPMCARRHGQDTNIAALIWSFFDICQFTLAVFMCIYMFGRIIYTLSTRPNPNAETAAVRNQIARMLILNGSVFFVCLLPFRIIQLYNISIFLRGPSVPLFANAIGYTLAWVGRVTTLLNSAVNPFLYNVSNAKYRAAFVDTFTFRKSKKNQENDGRVVTLTTGSSTEISTKSFENTSLM